MPFADLIITVPILSALRLNFCNIGIHLSSRNGQGLLQPPALTAYDQLQQNQQQQQQLDSNGRNRRET